MAFWGLYGGLEDQLGMAKGSGMPSPAQGSASSAGSNKNNDVSAAKNTLGIADERAAKKQKLDLPSGLVPRAKKVGPAIPAPRNAILAQKGMKPVSTATKDVVHVSVNAPLVAYDDSVDSAFMSDSALITKALSEIKNMYDPLKPNDFHEYLQNRDREQEMARQDELKTLISAAASSRPGAPTSLTSLAPSSTPAASTPTPTAPIAKSPAFKSPFAIAAPSAAPTEAGFLKPPSKFSAPVQPIDRDDDVVMGFGGGLGGAGQMSVSSFMNQGNPLPPPSTASASEPYDEDDIDGVPINLSATNIDAMDIEKREDSTPAVAPLAPPPPGVKGKKKLSIAEQMMLKMGWKGMGHGLGKNQQGIAEPIIMQATGVAGQGIIIGPRLSNAPLVNMPDTRVIILTVP